MSEQEVTDYGVGSLSRHEIDAIAFRCLREMITSGPGLVPFMTALPSVTFCIVQANIVKAITDALEMSALPGITLSSGGDQPPPKFLQSLRTAMSDMGTLLDDYDRQLSDYDNDPVAPDGVSFPSRVGSAIRGGAYVPLATDTTPDVPGTRLTPWADLRASIARLHAQVGDYEAQLAAEPGMSAPEMTAHADEIDALDRTIDELKSPTQTWATAAPVGSYTFHAQMRDVGSHRLITLGSFGHYEGAQGRCHAYAEQEKLPLPVFKLASDEPSACVRWASVARPGETDDHRFVIMRTTTGIPILAIDDLTRWALS